MVVDRIKFAPRYRVPKPAWYKASDSDISSYKNCLLQNLSDLDIPFTALLCRNVMCSDPSHTAALQSLASSIAAACVTAVLSSIPQTNNRQDSERLPGWNDCVAPYRSKSLFWHNIWVACERPRNGVVADIMRRTRAQYHRAIRLCQEKRTRYYQREVCRNYNRKTRSRFLGGGSKSMQNSPKRE